MEFIPEGHTFGEEFITLEFIPVPFDRVKIISLEVKPVPFDGVYHPGGHTCTI